MIRQAPDSALGRSENQIGQFIVAAGTEEQHCYSINIKKKSERLKIIKK